MARAQLERTLQRRHVIALAFGAMVGWSWVLLTGPWIARAGAAGAMLAFLLAGVAMVLIALTYAELAAAMPHTGGEHVYTERAFGRGWSFVCTWSLLLGYMSVVAFEAVALPFALALLFPAIKVGHLWQIGGWDVYASQVAIGIAAAIGLTAVNVRGVTSAASLQGFVTTFVVISGVTLLLGAGINGSAANFAPLFVDGARGVLGVVVMVPLMFVGFDVIPQAAAEIALPPRRIGALLVASVLCAVLWYALIIFAVAWILDAPARAQAELTTAAAARVAWRADAAGTLLICGGIAGIVTTWNAFLVGASRLVYVLAADSLLPAWLCRAKTQPGEGGTAVFGRTLWVLCALSCLAPWFGRPALVWLVNAGSAGVIVAYLLVAAAFLVLRRREPEMPRPYRVPGGYVIGGSAVVLSFAIAMLYLPWSPSALAWPQEWLICCGWITAGLALYRSSGARSRA